MLEAFPSTVGSSSTRCRDELRIDDVQSLEGKACTTASTMLGMSSAVIGRGAEFGGVSPGLVGGRVHAHFAADV